MPLFTYTRDIPATNNDPSDDQPSLTINTNSGDDIWDVDHYGFEDNDGGLHRYARFTSQSAPTLVDNSVGGFFATTFQGAVYPHWVNAAGNFPVCGPVSPAQLGNAWLAQNILWQWGIVTTNGSSSQAVTFNTPFDSQVFNIQLTPISVSLGSSPSFTVAGGTDTANGFTVNKVGFSAATVPNFYWSAVGIKT